MHRAFTLVELLVVIGIIALLIGILLPVLGEARSAAAQTRALSDVRQLLVAHQFYRLDHEGAVPLGYPPSTLHGEPYKVEWEGTTLTGLVAQRYPCRLIGYLEDVWDVAYSGQPSPDLDDAYATGIATTFGINAVFVGGDYDFRHRGFVDRLKAVLPESAPAKYAPGSPSFMVPNVNRHVVFKESEVREPTSLIVFADTQLRSGTFGAAAGYCNVNGPWSNGQNWTTEPDPESGHDQIRVLTTSKPIGIPQGRYGKGAAVGFFDGHAASLWPEELDDMRLWSNFAETADYDFIP